MENAKNSFYVALRNRLATVNPERTVVVRGIVRPGIMVEENEAKEAMTPPDVFVMRWTKLAASTYLPEVLAEMECEVHYATDGNAYNAGLDRGRVLAAMDGELLAIMQPYSTLKVNYAVSPAAPMETNVFWGSPVFGAMKVDHERQERVATVQVFSYQEPGEL